MARYRKTPYVRKDSNGNFINVRGTYKQYDDDGKFLCEYRPGEDPDEMVLTIEEERELVRKMHYIDDAEVRVNNKERRLHPFDKAIVDEERARISKEFEEKYGYKPGNDILPNCHRGMVYLDALAEIDDEGENSLGDSSRIQAALAIDPSADEGETAVECMRRLIIGFTDREREVYEIVFMYPGDEKVKLQDAARRLKITPTRVSQIVKSIKKKLYDNRELRRYFRDIQN